MKHLNAKQQGRLDGFFTVKTKEPEPKGKGKGKDGKKDDGKKGAKRKVNLRSNLYGGAAHIFFAIGG